MSDVRRLIELTRDGDAKAARDLLRVARRNADPTSLRVAAIALGAVDLLARLVVENDHDAEARDALTRLAGFTLDDSIRTWIRAALEHVNGNRRERRLEHQHVLEAMFDAAVGEVGIAWRHAGDGNQGPQRSALCLAVRRTDPQRLVVGIAEAGAKGISPGRAWTALRGWRRNDLLANERRIDAWLDDSTADDSRIRVPLTRSEVSVPPPNRGARRVAELRQAIEREASFGERFDDVRKRLLRWPDDVGGLDEAVRIARDTVTTWPPEARIVGPSWWRKRAAGKPTPIDGLVAGVDLTAWSAPQTCQALAHPAMAGLSALLVDGDDAVLQALATTPHLAAIETLDISRVGVSSVAPARIANLFASDALPALAHLRASHLVYPERPDADAAAVETFGRYALPARTLCLRSNMLPTACFEALFRAPGFATVERLRADFTRMEPPALEALADASLPNLHFLRLGALQTSSRDAWAALGRATGTSALAELVLYSVDEAAAAFFAEPRMAGIEALWLKVSARTPVGPLLHALVASPHTERLRALRLDACKIVDDDIDTLVKGEFPALRRLELRHNRIGDDGLRALATWPALEHLEALDLLNNPAGRSGRRALRRSPHWHDGLLSSRRRSGASAEGWF